MYHYQHNVMGERADCGKMAAMCGRSVYLCLYICLYAQKPKLVFATFPVTAVQVCFTTLVTYQKCQSLQRGATGGFLQAEGKVRKELAEMWPRADGHTHPASERTATTMRDITVDFRQLSFTALATKLS